MYSKNKVPPISNLSDVQLKLFDFVDFENHVRENSKFDLDYSVKRNENEVYEYNQGFCKHCYSRNVVKQGYNPKMIIDDNGEVYNVKVQRYECKECGKFSQTEFKDDYAPYCNYSNKTVDKIPLIRELDLISLRILSLILEITMVLNYPMKQSVNY